ncbi:MAG: DUF7282 domain-containing protein [Minisyncoccota bacterium]
MRKNFSLNSFTVGFMLGAILVGAWFLGGNLSTGTLPATAPSLTTNVTSASEVTPSPNGALAVADQPAGSSVTVESVTVPPPGVWIAVQETENGALGNVLGATRVHGPLSGVVVNLLRNTEPGQTYAVVLYRDGGDGGVFDLKIDSVYVDLDSGKRVLALFRTERSSAATTSSTTL